MKTFFKIFALSAIFSLFIDYFFGERLLYLVENKKNLRPENPIFGYHTLNKNLNASEGIIKICTDNSSFRISCNNKNKEFSKNYDVFFIGDSFTEGYQVNNDETFVSIIQKKTNLRIANLGVSSYAPTVYLEKIKYYIDKNYKFKELVIYIDISDIIDETRGYKYKDKKKRKFKNFFRKSFPFFYNSLRNIFHIIKKNNNDKKIEKFPFVKKENYWDLIKFEKIFLNKGFNDLASWTYNETEISKKGISKSLKMMEKLYLICKENNIKFSISIYPWPHQLKYDSRDSKQVKIWKKFCENKCEKFINNFPAFFDSIDEKGLYETVKTYYLPNDVHFSNKGHYILAENFINSLND